MCDSVPSREIDWAREIDVFHCEKIETQATPHAGRV
jgi:hypothetical protein